MKQTRKQFLGTLGSGTVVLFAPDGLAAILRAGRARG